MLARLKQIDFGGSYFLAGFKSPTRHSPAKAARRAGSQCYGDGA
jgi:hypothetical protein